MRDQVVQPVGAHHPRLHRLAARRPAGDARDIHVAIGGQRQGARNRRRRHHQHIARGLPLPCKLHALMHAEAVLLVHHRQAQIAEGDIFGEQRMGADQDIDLARRQRAPASRPGRRLSRARSGRPAARPAASA